MLPRAKAFSRGTAASGLRWSPAFLPLVGFFLLILLGSVLLALSPMHKEGRVGYLDALFTSTSAVCVTGLTTVDTATDYTVGGQIVILLLIQAGGLGVMAYAALAFTLMGRRLSLRARVAVEEPLFQGDTGLHFRRRLRQVFAATFLIEASGALLLFFSLLPDSTAAKAAWSAVFHAVSAFCNAGFSIFPGNLVSVRGNHAFLAVIALLIVAGGLGFMVLVELWRRMASHWRDQNSDPAARLSLHTRTVLGTSAALIIGGAALLLLFGVTSQENSFGAEISAAFFQSVSARTCGFNTISLSTMPMASLLVMVALMFIGASPGSCGGGVKTTSLAVMMAHLRSLVGRSGAATLAGRRLAPSTVQAASLLFALALIWNLLGLLILSHLEGGRPDIGLHDVLFEQVSAFGTVGLSTGITGTLSALSKVWLIITMYVGRLGPLTLASAVARGKPAQVILPEGKVMIG